MHLPHSLTQLQLFGIVTAGAFVTLLLSTVIDSGLRIAHRLGFM